MKKNGIVSSAVVRRLPKYYRYLGDLEKAGKEKISSQELSEKTGFTASQIRQDLNHFGGFGQQGYGYQVSALRQSIKEIIGLEKGYNAIIVGFGNIGQAIYKYDGFNTEKFDIIGVFDKSDYVNTGKNQDVEIKSIDEIEGFLSENEVDIAVLAVPEVVAQEVTDMLVANGVKSIWNFAPVDVKAPEEVPVENVHLSESLYTLIYYLGNNDDYKAR